VILLMLLMHVDAPAYQLLVSGGCPGGLQCPPIHGDLARWFAGRGLRQALIRNEKAVNGFSNCGSIYATGIRWYQMTMDTVCVYLLLPEKMDSLTPSWGPKGLTKIVQLNLIHRTKYVISSVLLKFVQSNPQKIDKWFTTRIFAFLSFWG
jgi:hypothetical protein